MSKKYDKMLIVEVFLRTYNVTKKLTKRVIEYANSSFKEKRILEWWLFRTSAHKMIKGTWNWHRNNLKRYETRGGKH